MTNDEQNDKGCVENPFAWAEVPVTDMERAKQFFNKVFGYQFQMQEMHGYQMAMFPMSMQGTGASGALMKGTSYVPSYDGTVIYFSVNDIDATLKKVTASGGKVVQNKKSIGPYGSIAFFEDTEGNRLALHQKPD